MRRTGMVVIGVFLLTLLAVGVLWATGTPAEKEQKPRADAPSAEEPLGFCLGLPFCNDTACEGPGCDETCPIEGTNTGWTRCCHNGNELDCSPGTVYKTVCECDANGGGFCSTTHAFRYDCG